LNDLGTNDFLSIAAVCLHNSIASALKAFNGKGINWLTDDLLMNMKAEIKKQETKVGKKPTFVSLWYIIPGRSRLSDVKCKKV